METAPTSASAARSMPAPPLSFAVETSKLLSMFVNVISLTIHGQTHGMSSRAPRHPVRVVAERTGLSPDTLRAWERRYGAVRPGRSDGDQRLYSDHDIERLVLISQLAASGYALGDLSRMSAAALVALSLRARPAAAPAPTARSSSGNPGALRPDADAQFARDAEAEGAVIVARLHTQLRALDLAALRATLSSATLALG